MLTLAICLLLLLLVLLRLLLCRRLTEVGVLCSQGNDLHCALTQSVAHLAAVETIPQSRWEHRATGAQRAATTVLESCALELPVLRFLVVGRDQPVSRCVAVCGENVPKKKLW